MSGCSPLSFPLSAAIVAVSSETDTDPLELDELEETTP